MKKRILSIALCICMALTLLPTAAFAASDTTKSVFGLTVTGPSNGFEICDSYVVNKSGAIIIKSAGTYTISGTYKDNCFINVSREEEYYEASWAKGHANDNMWRGIIDTTNATGNVTIILDNVTIQTKENLNMPIILSRTGSDQGADVTIQLNGKNTLSSPTLYSGGAIVKQGGSGSLTFTGNGSLDATANGVVIGAPYVATASGLQPYNCTNITFAQTGTITATSTSDASASVGAAGGIVNSTNTVQQATASNITVSSGILNLKNTATKLYFYGAMLGSSSLSPSTGSYYDNISITGGKITASKKSNDHNVSAVGGLSYSGSGITVSGGTIITDTGISFQPTNAYGAYIGTANAVTTLSAKVNGNAYTYTQNGVEPQEGKVWVYLPEGNAAVTLNGTAYYGTVDKSNNTVLTTSFTPVTGITNINGVLDETANYSMDMSGSLALSCKVHPDHATMKTIVYSIANAGNTGATLAGNRLTATAPGTVTLRATAPNGGENATDFFREFVVTVTRTPVTDITGVPSTMKLNDIVYLNNGFIQPANASAKTINWTLGAGSPATLTSTIYRTTLTATGVGKIKLTATVPGGNADGSDFVKSFTITVSRINVTGITATIPSTLAINDPLTLSGKVNPDNASYRNIIWSVTNQGTTSASITGNVLTAPKVGTLTLRATVTDGLANGDYTQDYTIQVFTSDSELSIASGSITITSAGNTNNTVTYAGSSSKTVAKSDPIVVTGRTTDGSNQIIVKNTTATVLLKGVTMTNNTASCIDLKGKANLTLRASTNSALSFRGAIGDDAGRCYAAIHVPTDSTLVYQDGGGTLTVTHNGNPSNMDPYGAVIGGAGSMSANGEDAGTIKIEGGTLTVSTPKTYGAAIGGGGSNKANGGTGGKITIIGGTVTATATSKHGTAIGGGYGAITGGAGGKITISGGTVTASDGDGGGAVIGGGRGATTGGAGGAVTISGGTVTATAGEGAAMAIGGGLNGKGAVANNGTLTITGGSVLANRSLTGGTAGNNKCVVATNGTNGGGAHVYKTAVRLEDTVGKSTALTGKSSIGSLNYGFKDVSTDSSGNIYLYLPAQAHTAIIGGKSGYTGSTNTDNTGVLTLGDLSATLDLGSAYLTDSGIAASATPNLNGTVHYLAVKNGTAGKYADAAALVADGGKKSTTVTADTAATLTGMPAIEGTYMVYAALISTSGTYKSDVMTTTVTIFATAPAATDVSIDYASEKLKAADGLGYSLQYFTTADATTGGTAISIDGAPITSQIGNTVYIRKVFTDQTVGGAALELSIPPRPDAPFLLDCTSTANSITVTAQNGAEYSKDSTSWDTSGSFTGLTPVKNYTIYARTKATATAFVSAVASTTVSTVATVEKPTKAGNGAAFAGNTVKADKTTVGAGESVTYTVTAITGYTPTLTVNNSPVNLVGTASPYTYTYTPTEGTASIAAAANFAGTKIKTISVADVTMFADDSRNADKDTLETHLKTLTVTAKGSDGATIGTLPLTSITTTGIWSRQGGTYTYTATASNNITCNFTVTVNAVNAAITAPDAISKWVEKTGYPTTGGIGLPDTLKVTYTGTGYTEQTDTLGVSWSDVPAGFGKTATTQPFTGTVALPPWATGTATTTVNVTITPKNAATVTVQQADGTYNTATALADPSITVKDKDGNTLTGAGNLTIRYSGTLTAGGDYASSAAKPTQPGNYTVTVTYEDDSNLGEASANFTINKAASDPDIDDNKGNKVYTYGDVITLTATPVILLGVESNPPQAAPNIVDFYYQKSATEFIKLNTSSVAVDGTSGTASFGYNTTAKTLPIGTSTIIAAYGGSDVLESAFDSMTVTLNAKPLTGAVAANTTKTYDGNADFSDVTVTLDGVEGSDDITTATTASLTASSKNAGSGLSVVSCSVAAPEGTDAEWYTAPTTLTGTVAITAKSITVATATVSDKEYDGNTTATVTAVTLDGLVSGESLTLGNDYTAAGVFTSAAVSDSATANVTVTLTATTAAGNYTFANDAASKTTATAAITAKAISGTPAISLDTDANSDGISNVGDTLHVTGVTPDGATLTYSWKLDGGEVGTDETYTVAATDAGKLLTVTVTGTGNYSGELTSTSYKVGARALAGTVAITGHTTVGSVLTAALTSTAGTPAMTTDYRVQWYRTVNGTETAISGATSLTYTLTNADLGATLKAELIADVTGSAFSGTVTSSGTDIPAIAPSAAVITATAGSGKVTLSWSAPFNGGSAITGYKLYVKEGSKDYGTATDLAASATSYEATSLTNGTVYTFKLETINVVGVTASAEATATPAAQSSGGGGGATAPSVTVPVSSDEGKVNVSTSVSGGTATITVTDQQLAEVASSTADTGTVTVDLSGLKSVDGAKIPAKVITAVNTATGSEGLEIILPTGTVKLDETALASVASANKEITVSVEEVKASSLTTAQKEALGDKIDSAVVVDVNVLANGTKTSSFNGGTLTVSFPYTPKTGEDTSKLTVWFIKDDGTVQTMGGHYDAKSKCFVFETTHLSQYVLVSDTSANPFTDVADSAYYYGAVNWAVDKGVTSGTSTTTFNPNGICTRAQTVTFLWRAMGSPEPTATVNPFTDVKSDAYYYKAVLWAVEKGITSGTGATTFSPNAVCSRSQVVTFLWRAEGKPVVNYAMNFTDVTADSYYAEAVRWAVSEGITGGTGANTFSPVVDCTRAQIVTFLYRCLSK